MRHLLIVLCTAGVCGVTSPVIAQPSSLSFTLDLLAACTVPTGCHGKHDTDIGFQLQADSFTYTASSDGSYGVAALTLNAPLACGEISSTGLQRPAGAQRFQPVFTNPVSSGLLEFNAGGAPIVDLGALTYDGTNPAGVAASYNNYGSPSLPPMVTCYQINPVTGGPAARAQGAYGIFRSSFEDHASGEPWVTVQTVNSPNAGSIGNMPTPTNTFAYVAQIHNASSAVGWRLSLGYDQAFFDAVNSGTVPSWCILGANLPQPGSTSGTATCNAITQPYTVSAADIQSATNSVYIFVAHAGSTAATTGWSSVTAADYPAVASVFPPFDTYPQRFDDKVAVASRNNQPVLNIGSIVCANDKTSTSCTLYNPEGYPVPAQVKYHNSINASGAVSVDPVAYFVDPYGGSTLPGNASIDALSVGAGSVSCNDPGHILAGTIDQTNFTVSSGAQGALQFGFNFATAGALYIPGTASCTATFNAANYTPALATTQSFTITMLPAQTTHFSVTAPAGATAGTAISNVVVTALDAANNTVTNYSGTVHFSSSDTSATVPADATLSGGTGTFGATFKTSGPQTITATDTVTSSLTGTSNSVSVDPAPATHFRVNAPANTTMGNQFTISVTALDQFNNTDTNYGGTVHFTSTDGAASLPGNMTLTFGVGTPGVTLNTTGPQTVTATDTVTSSITGTSSAITVN